MADVLPVHRCRFIHFNPSPITALAFPPLPLPKNTSKHPSQYGTLAVGHANGNIDLCEWAGGAQSPQAWTIRTTLSGPYPSKVDSLAFAIRHPDLVEADATPSCSDLRLFSSGGGSELVEWDMERGCVRRTISSQGGSIWSISVNPASNLIALGCEDGTVRLLSIANDTLSHYRRFDRVKCRVLSIAWGPPTPKPPPATVRDVSSDEDDEDYWTDSWLVTGGSDSSLRKWDVKNGRVIDRMGTDRIRGERTLVWAVGVLSDGTIVSGDSVGMVKFWDSRTCTQLQSFQAHGADVLCLTVDPTGTAVYTSGVDQKITQFCYLKTSTGEKTTTRKWIQTSSRRMHSHDVRALAIWPPYSVLPSSHKRQIALDVVPLLASGGLDMSVVITPAALSTSTLVKIANPIVTSVHCTFEDSYHRRLAYSSGPSSTSAIRVARGQRFICCARDNGLDVWRILKKPISGSDEDIPASDEPDAPEWEKVLDMELNVHTNILASDISDDGRWLVASDLYETKLFSLVSDLDGNITPKRIRDFATILSACLPPKSTSTGGLAFCFTPDSSKLVISTAAGSYVLVVDLGRADQQPRVLRRFDHHRTSTSPKHRVVAGRSGSADEEDGDVPMEEGEAQSEPEADTPATPTSTSILRLATSYDGQWLASSDVHGRTHIFNLDSVQHHCMLPSFPLPAQSLAFDPSRPNILVLAFPNNTIQIFDVEARNFPAWGKEICESLPKRLTRTHDHVLGVLFDPALVDKGATPRSILLWGATWLCRVKLDMRDTGARAGQRKRRREGDKSIDAWAGSDDGFKMITHYRPILCVDFLGPRELVVVERPLVDVLATLPPAYFVHKYGT
ncbi:WD-REPEATS-REGION domain-containing protein [Mycena kentingensis (nom. inval.)]|nr:WD-REPEATS-REGION domain-containing protein [Mycena kentingensis (nom. inval.)]